MKLEAWKYFSLIIVLVLSIGTGGAVLNPSPAAAAAPPEPTWWARYGSANENQPTAIVADSQGNVYVTGCSNTGRWVYATAKYGKNYVVGQAPAWSTTWKLAGVDANFQATAIALDSTGVYVTGCGYDASYNNIYYTLKYDLATGAQLWASPATCVGESVSDPPHIAVDDSGVYVSGTTWRSSIDYVTIKYNKTTGATLWGPVYYDGAADNDNDYARGIAVYSGGVYITGYSEKHQQDPDNDWDDYFDLATIKYDATTGSQQWTHRIFTWDSSEQDQCYIAADSSGVYVAASSYLGNRRNTLTVKYPLNSATPVWGPVYYGGQYGHDKPAGIAVDSSGAYVTGSINDSSGDDHYYTRKYGAADGSVKWEKTYTTYIGDDRGIAVDSTGVYVSGYVRFTESPQYYKYATIKYALSDGVELWSPAALFSGESFSYGCYAYAITADGSGGGLCHRLWLL